MGTKGESAEFVNTVFSPMDVETLTTVVFCSVSGVDRHLLEISSLFSIRSRIEYRKDP